jgi:molybdate transport system substrate-binding protein
MRAVVSTVAAIGMISTAGPPGLARAAEVNAIVSGALTGAFRELIPQFEKLSGHKIIIAWGPSSGTSDHAIPIRIQNKEPADVLIMVGPALDKLIRQAKFTAEYSVNIAESKIGVGVKKGEIKPDVSTVATLKQTLLLAKSVGYSEGASGVYISTKLFKTLGIDGEMAVTAKLVTGELVGEAVARGEIDLGLQQISELVAVSGVDFVGPLPDEVQFASPISAAVAQDAKERDAAKAFLDFLMSDEAAPALRKSGLDTPIRAK